MKHCQQYHPALSLRQISRVDTKQQMRRNSRTIPELLLVFERVRDIKVHGCGHQRGQRNAASSVGGATLAAV